MSYIYKPVTRKGPVWITPTNEGPPTIKLPDGRVFTGVPANQRGGVFQGHEGFQWVFDNDVIGHEGAVLTSGGKTQTLGNTSMSYRGNAVGSLGESAKGAVGSPIEGGYAPGQVGQFGFAPANLEGMFPSPTFANFDSIKTAPYKFTNPFDFAKKFGEFNRTELRKNYDQSKEFGLEALDTELKGLQGFVPAASALQRQEVALDNTFNQAERTKQIDSTLPGVRDQLTAQGTRAETYAGGKLPSSIDDRAYEVASRSRAADVVSAGGFGTGSLAGRKASDLMSAEDRLNLSKYGDSLLTQNIGTKANLLLAPTEYANAGSQVRIMPTADAATRAAQLFGEINNQTLVSTTNALNSTIQQRQFKTNLEQNTRQFNASGNFSESQFNAGVANTFALQKFGYQVGYAGTVAGAAQTDLNTGVAIQQQNDAAATFDDNKDATQNSNNIGAAVGAAAAVGSFVADYFSGPSKKPTQEGTGKPSATGTAIQNSPPAPIVSGPGDITDIPSSEPDISFSDNDPVGSGDTGGTDLGDINDFSVDDSSPRMLRLTGAAGIAPSHVPQIKGFMKEVGEGLPPRIKVETARQMAVSSDHALKAGGLSRTPRPGYVQSGYGVDGKPVYADKALLNNPSTEPGRRDVETVKNIFKPFKSFTVADQRNMEKIGRLAEPAFIDALDALSAAKDPKAFARMLTHAVKAVTTVT